MVQNRIATVFGGTGFIGHTIVQALAARGYIVRIPTRFPEKAKDLKPMGDVGQILVFQSSIKTDMAVARAIEGSEIVVNLIGILSEKKNGQFQSMHVETAARIARLSRKMGVGRLIHFSALGADLKATAAYARSKAIGEEAVRAFFPQATIFRPSVVFGPRDQFLARFARMARFMPFLPLIGGGRTLFQPVYVGDVAAAVLACLQRPSSIGHTFALGGPKIYSLLDLLVMILNQMHIKRPLINVPWAIARWKAALIFEHMPNPPLTRDQIDMLQTDNIIGTRLTGRANPLQIGQLEDLGLRPTALEDVLPSYFDEGRAPI